jgi:hypothetical protein
MSENPKKYSNSKAIVFGLIAAALVIAGGAWLDKLSREATAPTTEQNTELRSGQMDYVSYKGEEGKKALTILKSSYQVETQTFAGAGEFVTAINGIKGDSKNFWAFYVNGKQAEVGAGQYTTKSSDLIEWKYEAIKDQPE